MNVHETVYAEGERPNLRLARFIPEEKFPVPFE